MLAPFTLLLAAVLTLGTATPQSAQRTKEETATQCYLRFRATAHSATSIDEIKPFWSADLLEQYNMAPEDQRTSTLALVKRVEGDITDVIVLKETATATGTRLSLEARRGPDRKPVTGTIDLRKENDAWKIDEAAHWTPKGL
jgi:hypothetical protein